MKFLFEMFPIILFFASYKFKDIYFATAVAIGASILQIAFSYYKNKKIEKPMIISLALITVFGGATLLLHDNFFIRMKPTVLYWIFSVSLLVARFVFKKNLIKAMLQKQIVVPDSVWGKLNIAWVLFFMVMGCLNLYIAFTYSEQIWVNFKLFGTLGCMIVFVVLQGIILSSYLKETPEDKLT